MHVRLAWPHGSSQTPVISALASLTPVQVTPYKGSGCGMLGTKQDCFMCGHPHLMLTAVSVQPGPHGSTRRSEISATVDLMPVWVAHASHSREVCSCGVKMLQAQRLCKLCRQCCSCATDSLMRCRGAVRACRQAIWLLEPLTACRHGLRTEQLPLLCDMLAAVSSYSEAASAAAPKAAATPCNRPPARCALVPGSAPDRSQDTRGPWPTSCWLCS